MQKHLHSASLSELPRHSVHIVVLESSKHCVVGALALKEACLLEVIVNGQVQWQWACCAAPPQCNFANPQLGMPAMEQMVWQVVALRRPCFHSNIIMIKATIHLHLYNLKHN